MPDRIFSDPGSSSVGCLEASLYTESSTADRILLAVAMYAVDLVCKDQSKRNYELYHVYEIDVYEVEKLMVGRLK